MPLNYGATPGVGSADFASCIMPENDLLKRISFRSAIHDVEVYGLILLNLEGCVVSWNQGGAHLLGYSESEVIGRNFEFLFTPEDRAAQVPQREIAKAMRDSYAYDDRWHLRKDQRPIFVNGGLCLLKSETGQPIGFVKIVRDQTERKMHIEEIEELNAQLAEAKRGLERYAATLEEKVQERTKALNDRNTELQDFCYSIAHDIRAPLRNIQAFSEVTLEDYGTVLDVKGQEYLERIATSASRLDRLTQDLLEYTRFSREEISLTVISLEQVVDEALANLSADHDQNGATIKVRRPLPRVIGQYSYAVQILGNFLSNALKFVRPGQKPDIEVWAEIESRRARIFVKDEGIGVPLEYQQKVFGLFERLHPQASFEGTGVGLAIAKKAAQRMNGDVGIISESDRGSTLWLELEIAK